MKKALFIPLLLIFFGCGAAKPIPGWIRASHNQLESYKQFFLSGSDKIATLRFNGALDEIKKSGNLQILSRAYLTRMSLQTAVLEPMDTEEFLKLERLSPSQENDNYYLFLQGKIAEVDAKLLPAQYQDCVKNLKQDPNTDCLSEMQKMKDQDLSQLIVIGILVRLQKDNEALLQKATAIASSQGWKKALIAYLEHLRILYESKQDGEKAREIEQRIKIISS